MMRHAIALIFAVFLLTGCGSLKEKVGELEKEALVQSISDSVDKKLEARGLSLATLKQAVDPTASGHSSQAEVASMAKEAALLETKKLLDEKAAEFKASHVTRDEFGQEHESFLWKIVLGAMGLVSTFLGKQVVSGRREAKKHANYHARMAVLEAIVGKKAANLGEDESPEPTPPAAPPTT